MVALLLTGLLLGQAQTQTSDELSQERQALLAKRSLLEPRLKTSALPKTLFGLGIVGSVVSAGAVAAAVQTGWDATHCGLFFDCHTDPNPSGVLFITAGVLFVASMVTLFAATVSVRRIGAENEQIERELAKVDAELMRINCSP